MSPPAKIDVGIAGASYAGMALALALARGLEGGLAVALIDLGQSGQQADASHGSDPRAVSLSASSRHLLEALDIWPAIADAAEPVRRIEITDSSLDAGIRPVLLAWENALGGTTADAGSPGETAAHIVPLPKLGNALAAAVAAEPSIRIFRPAKATALTADTFYASIELASGDSLTTRLAVAADGQHSVLRRAAGITCVSWPYEQIAIATTVAHERDHGGVAVQHFLPAGPFAILPLPGRRCCITWTEEANEGRRIMALDDDAFLAEVDRRFGGRLGAVRLDGGRRSWPLHLQLARSYIGDRLALIGDAAHGVHPIAGQGLNLAFRDVAALAEVVADAARTGLDIGDATTLARYQQWRRFDALAATAAFDAVNRLFSRDGRLTRSLREAGLQLIDRLPRLKQELVREAAGMTGELPRLLKGERI